MTGFNRKIKPCTWVLQGNHTSDPADSFKSSKPHPFLTVHGVLKKETEAETPVLWPPDAKN